MPKTKKPRRGNVFQQMRAAGESARESYIASRGQAREYGRRQLPGGDLYGMTPAERGRKLWEDTQGLTRPFTRSDKQTKKGAAATRDTEARAVASRGTAQITPRDNSSRTSRIQQRATEIVTSSPTYTGSPSVAEMNRALAQAAREIDD